MDENTLSREIIGAAIEVHRNLGPGLLESVYESALACELELRCIPYERQKPIPVIYKGVNLDVGFRLDLLVDRKVLLELKAVEQINPVHQAQVATYLKLTGIKLALLLNFNVVKMVNGIHRWANGMPEAAPAYLRKK